MYSGAPAATVGTQERGTATVTSPAPDFSAPTPRQTGRPRTAQRARHDKYVTERALVSLCGPLRDQPPHGRRRRQLEARAGGAVDDKFRYPDVGDEDITRAVAGWRKDQRNLRRGQGNRQVGVDRRTDLPVAVRRQPGGQIDGHDRDRPGIDVVHHGRQHPAQRAVQAGPEDGVHEQIVRRQRWPVPRPGGRVGRLDNPDAQPAQHVEVRPRIAAHVGRRPEQEYRDVRSALPQLAGHDEPVPAVAAAAAQDRHPAFREVVEGGCDHIHHPASGVLHQYD